jgi:exonuclease SbcC
MLPQYLRFAGVLCYIQETTIDFTDLFQEGLFGIFGKTGSGKSAILDAMAIALFDATERTSSPSDFLNRYVKDPFVQFRFQTGGHTYEVLRQWRRSKHEEQLVEFQHKTARFAIDGQPVEADRKRDVQAYIQQALGGMGLQHFTLTHVIPQGEFARFLQERPAERQQHLHTLLRLDRFDFQEVIKNQRNELNSQIQGVRGELKGLEEATPDRVKALQQAIHKLQQQREEAARQISTLEQEVQRQDQAGQYQTEWETAQQELARLAEQAEYIQAQEQALNQWQAARQVIPYLEQYEAAQAKVTASENQLQATEQALAQAQAHEAEQKQAYENAARRRETEKPGLEQSLRQLSEAKPYKQQLTQAATTLADERSEHAAAQEAVTQAQQALDTVNQTLQQREEARAALDRSLQALQQAQEAEQALQAPAERWQQVAQELAKRRQTYRTQEAKLKDVVAEREQWTSDPALAKTTEALREQLAAQQAKLQEQQQTLDYWKAQQRWAQAVDELTPGEPCPLCGSTAHPAPVKPPEEAEQALREAQQAYESQDHLRQKLERALGTLPQLQQREQELRQALQELQDEGTALRQEQDQLQERLGERSAEELQALPQRIRERSQELARQRQQLQASDTAIQDLRQQRDQTYQPRLQSAQQRRQRAEQAIEQARQQYEQARQQLAAFELAPDADLAAREKALSDQLQQLEQAEEQGRLAYQEAQQARQHQQSKRAHQQQALADSRQEAAQSWQKLEAQIAAAGFASVEALQQVRDAGQQRDWAALQQEIEQHKQRQATAANNEAYYAAKLKEQPYDEAAHRANKAALHQHRDQLQELDKQLGAQRRELESLQTQLQRRQALEQQLQQLNERLNRVKDLAQLLEGRRFAKYAASIYMNRVCAAASRRIAQLTGNRYALSVTPELHFRVLDRLNGGQQRSVNNLSGGETFIFSLCLALSLSELVAQRGPSFFFLDEGFGTLDEERLDEVMNVLEELRDSGHQVIGLISHVQALRERLQIYLEVEQHPHAERGSVVHYRYS